MDGKRHSWVNRDALRPSARPPNTARDTPGGRVPQGERRRRSGDGRDEAEGKHEEDGQQEEKATRRRYAGGKGKSSLVDVLWERDALRLVPKAGSGWTDLSGELRRRRGCSVVSREARRSGLTQAMPRQSSRNPACWCAWGVMRYVYRAAVEAASAHPTPLLRQPRKASYTGLATLRTPGHQ